ncbi:MAG: hypothetical protein A4E71_00521 [Smithella sp. PtaU1.Bin162]|nr:MAG: hypothetical protein A4E71_00521 [Smithella sp. PtaU1.Bin162]
MKVTDGFGTIKTGNSRRRRPCLVKTAGLKEPVFKFDSTFKVTFYRDSEYALKKNTEKVTENQQKIIAEMRKNPHVTAVELKGIIGISRKSVLENISKLKAKKIIDRKGPDKGGHWEIVDRG